MRKSNFLLLFIINLLTVQTVLAQNDPEFKQPYIMRLNMHNGMTTTFNHLPDLYVGGLQVNPEFTVVPNLLRLGAIGGVLYTGKKIQGAAGASASVKLLTIPAGYFGSAGNIHVSFQHLWVTEKQRLVGMGLHADLLNKITFGALVHRDYQLNSWWFQNVIGIRISKNKIKVPDFEK